MRLQTRLLVSLSASFALASLSSEARADDLPVAPSAPAAEAPVAAEAPQKAATAERFRPVTLSLNPLSFLLARFGANVEVLPAKHHAFMLSPYYQFGETKGLGPTTHHSVFAGEVSYRFYSGSLGANGLYVGPSFILGRESVRSLTPGFDTNITTIGAAIDAGGQLIEKNGLTIGLGAGVGYLTALDGNGKLAGSVFVDRPMLRMQFTVGYSF